MKKSTHHEPYWGVIRRIIEESDLVLEILDARMVELSRNEQVEEIIQEINRPMVFVINKSDLVSKQALNKQVEKLKEKGDVIFISAKSPKTTKVLLYAIKKLFKKHGKRPVQERGKFDPKPIYREAKGEIVVGVLGYPNVGKSSIINALAHKKKVKVSKKSGTTHGIHWIKASDEIKLIDSPGVIPLKKDDEIRYGLIGAKDTEKLKDPESVAHAIIALFQKNNPQALEKFYKIEITTQDNYEITEQIARKKAYLLKGNKIDEHRAHMEIIRDWQQGRLKL
jgi:ribosome biogenesis GTPase A